ncbi:transcriptional regulator NrdR [Clostridiaceae bacterium HSG29]|nr:transcriptional regulator NrdR [Clostridiaceae bacterium HSG29]
MHCPYCNYQKSKVIDTRPTDDGYVTRRRRECEKCGNRFTTYEKVERMPIRIVKKDGTRESYDRNKIINGIIIACEKRPVSINQIEKTVDLIEKELYNLLDNEISSAFIGELIMKKLKDLDEVAYVRFASVYRQFKDINTFYDELNRMIKEK